MTTNEANKTIAKYMGTYQRKDKDGYWLPTPSYSRELDSLIPVWKKLNASISHDACTVFWIGVNDKKGELIEAEATGETIQEAAAIATAKAIEELEG